MSGNAGTFLKYPRVIGNVSRPNLEKLFTEEIVVDKRSTRIIDAVLKYGYTQKQRAAHLNMHYSTISNLMRGKA